MDEKSFGNFTKSCDPSASFMQKIQKIKFKYSEKVKKNIFEKKNLSILSKVTYYVKKLERVFSMFCSLLRIYFVALLTENPINLLTLLHGWENKRKQKQISFQFSAYQLYSEKAESMLEIENLSEIGGSRKKTRTPSTWYDN